MTKLFSAIVLALSLVVAPAAALDLSKEKKTTNVEFSTCIKYSEFLNDNKGIVRKVYSATPEAAAKFKENLNKNRMSKGMQAWEFTQFKFAFLSTGSVGLVLIKGDGCILPQSIIAVSPAQLAQILTEAGLNAETDFLEESGA